MGVSVNTPVHLACSCNNNYSSPEDIVILIATEMACAHANVFTLYSLVHKFMHWHSQFQVNPLLTDALAIHFFTSSRARLFSLFIAGENGSLAFSSSCGCWCSFHWHPYSSFLARCDKPLHLADVLDAIFPHPAFARLFTDDDIDTSHSSTCCS